jgi:hypothetical protein
VNPVIGWTATRFRLSAVRNNAAAIRSAQSGEHMDDAISLNFDTDPDDLGDLIYIHCQAYSNFTDAMNHTEEDAFEKHLDNLIDHNKREQLAQYPFIFFRKPADFDRTKYAVQPRGPERAEWNAVNEHVKLDNAISRAKRHYYIMSLCGHPAEVEQLQHELTSSDEELCKLRRITDPMHLDGLRESIAWTLWQVQRMQKKYSPQEIADANAFLEEMDRMFPEADLD